MKNFVTLLPTFASRALYATVLCQALTAVTVSYIGARRTFLTFSTDDWRSGEGSSKQS